MLGALVLCSGLFTTVDIGARTELRLRGTTGPEFAVDFATMPYAQLESKSKHFDLKVGYAASLTFADLEYGVQSPQLFQLAALSAFYAAKHWVVGASQAGGYGDMNFSYLSPVPLSPGQPLSGPPPTNLIPCTSAVNCATETIHFGSSATTVVARYTGTRTSFAIAPSYSVSGGTDAASQALVPIVSQPRVDFVLERQIGRRDWLVTEGEGTLADSTPRACDPTTGGPAPIGEANPPLCAPHEQWVGLREKWRRRTSRRSFLEVSAGAIVARATIDADSPSQPYKVVPYPTANLLFAYALANPDPDRPLLHPVITDPPKPSFYISSRVGPIIDTRYGIIDPRFEVGAAVLDPLSPKYTLTAHAAFARSIPPTVLDATYFEAWVELLRRLDMYRFDAGGGLRGAYQHDPFTGEFFVISAYLTFVWHEPRIKL